MSNAVLLFDGVCNLCNSAIRFFYKRDVNNKLQYQSLQSNIGKELLATYNAPNNLSTIVFIHNKTVFVKSTAVLKALQQLPFPYSLAGMFLIVPKVMRDAVYDFVAANRYKWFGEQQEVCEYDVNFNQQKFGTNKNR